MAQENSQTWQNPTSIMRQQMLKRKNRALQARFSNALSPSKSNDRETSSIGLKRSNPFRQSPVKKSRLSVDEEDAASDASLFRLLTAGSSEKVPLHTIPLNFTTYLKKPDDNVKVVSEIDSEGFPSLPVDWSLKSRLRITSESPFPWSNTLRTSEEASGVTSFCRCLSVTDRTESMASIDTGANAQFHQRCLYWQHPSVPWLNLFPRLNKAGGNPLLSEEAQEALFKDWQESFRSAVTLIRACQCPYIYVCASSFVLLLRAAGVSGIAEMHALITPTTRGLRQLLMQEDIEFTSPFKGGRKLDPTDSGCDTQESGGFSATLDEKGQSDNEEGDGATDWLEEMGLTASSLPALKSKDKQELDKQREIDGFPESTLLIEGSSNILSLMNFFMTTSAHMSSTGSLAGVPPTILSPIAFKGATLKSYKVKQGESRVNGVDQHYVELVGPVLPSAVQSICDLLKDSVHEFSASANVVNVTKPLARCLGKESGVNIFGVENLSDCGLDEVTLKRFCEGSDGSKWITGFAFKQRRYRPTSF